MWLTVLKLLVPDLVLENTVDYYWGWSAIYLIYLGGADALLALFYSSYLMH